MTNTVKENNNLIEKTNIKVSNRKKTRKLLFQELYSKSVNKLNTKQFRESFFNNIHSFNIDENYLNSMHNVISDNEKFFIHIFKLFAPKFNIEKMSLLNILPIYIWLAEMFFLDEEIPAKVSINEAVEIAKVYWDDSAKKIVNWVLNKVYKDFDNLNKIKNNDYSNINQSCLSKNT